MTGMIRFKTRKFTNQTILDINQFIEDRPANKHKTYENSERKAGLDMAFFEADHGNANNSPHNGCYKA